MSEAYLPTGMQALRLNRNEGVRQMKSSKVLKDRVWNPGRGLRQRHRPTSNLIFYVEIAAVG